MCSSSTSLPAIPVLLEEDLEVLLAVEDHPQASARHTVIIGDRDRRHSGTRYRFPLCKSAEGAGVDVRLPLGRLEPRESPSPASIA